MFWLVWWLIILCCNIAVTSPWCNKHTGPCAKEHQPFSTILKSQPSWSYNSFLGNKHEASRLVWAGLIFIFLCIWSAFDMIVSNVLSSSEKTQKWLLYKCCLQTFDLHLKLLGFRYYNFVNFLVVQCSYLVMGV